LNNVYFIFGGIWSTAKYKVREKSISLASCEYDIKKTKRQKTKKDKLFFGKKSWQKIKKI
jgi:hypothetical protein